MLGEFILRKISAPADLIFSISLLIASVDLVVFGAAAPLPEVAVVATVASQPQRWLSPPPALASADRASAADSEGLKGGRRRQTLLVLNLTCWPALSFTRKFLVHIHFKTLAGFEVKNRAVS